MSIERIALVVVRLRMAGRDRSAACGVRSGCHVARDEHEPPNRRRHPITATAVSPTVNPTVALHRRAHCHAASDPRAGRVEILCRRSRPSATGPGKSYRRGLAMGRNPRVFSKIGDCQNITTYFLADFENPDKYRLGRMRICRRPSTGSRDPSAARAFRSMAG